MAPRSKAASIVDHAPLTAFHRRLTLYTTGGPFLDGYILSIIGVALLQIEPQFHLTTFWTGLIGASTLLGLFFGGLVFGYLTDLFGRHLMYTLDLAAIFIFSIWQAFAHGPIELAVLRFMLGIAVGADYPIATSLLAEFAPARHRGKMLGVLQSAWYVGGVAAYLVGFWLLSMGPGAWRWMLASSAVPALILLFMRWGTPESPRWLISKNRLDEAREVIKQVYGPDANLKDVGMERPKKTRISKLFQGEYLQRNMFIGLFWTVLIVPQFALFTFGPRILQSFGLQQQNVAFIAQTMVNVFYFVGCLPALWLVHRIGRRPLIIWCFAVMTLALLVVGLFPHAPIWFIFTGLALYAFFSGGPSVLTWIYPNELFPTEIRASAVGVGTAFSRIGSFIGTFLLPYALTTIGIGPTMLIGAGLTLFGFLISIAWAPETKGQTLAEASSVE